VAPVTVSVCQRGTHECALLEVFPEALLAGWQCSLTALQGEGDHTLKPLPCRCRQGRTNCLFSEVTNSSVHNAT